MKYVEKYSAFCTIGLVQNSSRCVSITTSISRRGVLFPRLTKRYQTFEMYNFRKSQFILDVSKYSFQPNSSLDSKQFEQTEMNTRFLSKSRSIESSSIRSHRLLVADYHTRTNFPTSEHIFRICPPQSPKFFLIHRCHKRTNLFLDPRHVINPWYQSFKY